MPTPQQALLVVFHSTALRKREAMHLTWSDVDLEDGWVHVNRHDAKGFVQRWSPKDHELRSILLPPQAIALLKQLQAIAPEGCPYVFIEAARWEYYRQQVEAGKWTRRRDLMNNVLRRFKTLCKRACVSPYTIHDLRRTCITNWARKCPVDVTQRLAGHRDIRTTREYYLSIQDEDLAKAKDVQAGLLAGLKDLPPTDPKLTEKAQKREFPQRKVFGGVQKPPKAA